MIKAVYSIAILVFLNIGSAALADDSFPIVDPTAASAEITELLAQAKPNEAAEAVGRKLPPMTSTPFNIEQLKSAFALLSKYGPAELKDEVLVKQYGQSVRKIIHYLYFPRQDAPANHFVFLRYTFMKGTNGWMMTTFDFKTSGIFPPPDWND